MHLASRLCGIIKQCTSTSFGHYRNVRTSSLTVIISEVLKPLPCGSHDRHHSHVATDRVSRLLMPLSTWLVIHKDDSTSTTPFSNPASLNRDMTLPPTSPEMFHLQHGKSSHIRRPPATTHSTTAAAEELMPRTLSPFHVLCHIVPPKMVLLMTHPHRSALVTASPIPAAPLHHTTRLAFSSGRPHQ